MKIREDDANVERERFTGQQKPVCPNSWCEVGQRTPIYWKIRRTR